MGQTREVGKAETMDGEFAEPWMQGVDEGVKRLEMERE